MFSNLRPFLQITADEQLAAFVQLCQKHVHFSELKFRNGFYSNFHALLLLFGNKKIAGIGCIGFHEEKSIGRRAFSHQRKWVSAIGPVVTRREQGKISNQLRWGILLSFVVTYGRLSFYSRTFWIIGNSFLFPTIFHTALCDLLNATNPLKRNPCTFHVGHTLYF